MNATQFSLSQKKKNPVLSKKTSISSNLVDIGPKNWRFVVEPGLEDSNGPGIYTSRIIEARTNGYKIQF